MLHTVWNNRETVDGNKVVHLFDDTGAEKATFPVSAPAAATNVRVGQQQWQLQGDKTHLEATLPSGERFIATAESKPFGRAKIINIDLAGIKVVAVNESRSDWVYVDSDDYKLGQFSGGNNGVRKAITEFEADAELGEDQKIFLSWVTRTALEAATMGSTLILTFSLLLVIPIVILSLLF